MDSDQYIYIYFNFPSEFNVHPGIRATGIKCLGKFHGKWSKEASIKFCLLMTYYAYKEHVFPF